PLFKGENGIATPQLDMMGGSNAINIGGIDTQRLNRIIQFMRRSFRAWKDCRRQETPQREEDCLRPHTRSVVTFGMREQGGRRELTTAD
ncbi:MAG: hypothetical protein DMG51_00615, partial [Acidobacteria bacterium]